MPNKLDQSLINHVLLLVDRSGSMRGRERQVIEALEKQVAFLADLSKRLDQETRVTIYQFDDDVECLVFDKDVLRLPSIAGHYRTRGQTALIDAVWESLDDMGQTFQKYGDHAFLLYIFTDGFENASRRQNSRTLRTRLEKLESNPDNNVTVGGFVPDLNSRMSLESCGIGRSNISLWDAMSTTGVEEASATMSGATENWMNMRASGVRASTGLFSTDAKAVNAQTIKDAGLKPLDPSKYTLTAVTTPREAKGEGVLNKDKHRVWEIQSFVEKINGGKFQVGRAFYELSKKEKIGGAKALAVLEEGTGKVYVGTGVRAMIGLPDGDKTVAPDFNPSYKIFVQSQSHNRHLVVGKRVLILQ